MDEPTSIQIGSISGKGVRRHNFALIATVIVLVAFLIFIFASYEGYVPFLKLSSSSNPYYSVANIQQLSSTVSKLSNSSSPFNLSYSLSLSLSATAGASAFSFNLPVNGYIAHYKPYTKETADLNIGALVKDISSLSSSINLSSFPKFLDTVNLTLLSNISYGTLCIPFSMIASAENTSLSLAGSAVNDSNVNNNSLLCVSLKTSNLTNSSIISGILSNQSANISNLSKFNNYVQVKYLKGESYNGNPCSLLDINTTSAFESKYNASMGFSFCFSNVYGMPLYGNFVLNLTKESSAIMNFLNSSGNAASMPNFSNIILSASLKSAFNPAPTSSSGLSSLPAGSYTLNESTLLKMLGFLSTPSVTVSTSGFSPFAIGSTVCNSTGTYLVGIVGGLPFGASNVTFDNFTIYSPSGFSPSDNFPINGTISPKVVTSGSTFNVNFPEAKCSTAGQSFAADGELSYNVVTSSGMGTFTATGTIAGISS